MRIIHFWIRAAKSWELEKINATISDVDNGGRMHRGSGSGGVKFSPIIMSYQNIQF